MLGAGQKMQQAQLLQQAQNLQTISSIALVLLSDIAFDSNNLNCYFHKSEKLVLLIPKEYIRSNLPEAMNFNLSDQAKVCGFNPTVLTAVTDVTSDNLIKQLAIQQSLPIDKEKFISHLTSMFTVQKKAIGLGAAKEDVSPEENAQWIIYLTGHGSAAYQTIGNMRKQLYDIKSSIANARRVPPKSSDYSKAQQYIRDYEPLAKKYGKMLEGKSNWQDSQIVPESARVAGITAQEFSQLMKFFDKNLDIAYIHYMTCFAGGSNQTFVNEVLSSLDVDFIVSSEGIHEGVVRSQQGFHWDSRSNKLKLTSQSFAEFFRLLRLFFTQPEQFVKIKGKAQDPILFILRTINPGALQESQPFVRFPVAGKFVAAAVDSKIEVLTQTIVRAHEIEKKPIDLSNKNIDTLIINTSRINVPLNLGKKIHTTLIFPSPKSFAPGYEAIYLLSEINYENTLQSFIFNCVYRNARLYTQTFVVNKLTDILYQQSGLPSKQGSINNFIMQMQSASDKNTMIANVQVVFEFDGNVYQSMFTIKDFEKAEQATQQIKFTATPVRSTNMTTVVNQFLTAQEVTKLAKPIRLQSIAEFFDDKIDQQDPSMAIWTEADLEDLQKFAEQRAKKQPARPQIKQPVKQQVRQRAGRRMRQ
ncbi:MAG TPA: hypothetical protein VJJ26_03015 [Candidatus Babeliales bacterium]|nr:hypothetical protein [Candidatus Babeliales bacterium]